MASYCPEMEEEMPKRLFHSEFIHGNSYALCWRVDDDQKARETLSKLQIRPKVIEMRKQEEGSYEAKRLESDVYGCLITSNSHRKLRNQDLTAVLQYLD